MIKRGHEVVLFRPELGDTIKAEIERIDLSKYKDSMSQLIKKDIHDLWMKKRKK
ncbi:MAG TPA: hypothetical protein VIL05_07840 [Thermoclostridium sp.]